MSIPFGRIYCTQCRYRTNTLMLAGRFQYVDGHGRRGTVDRDLGWCYHCLKVRPVERIRTVSECPKPSSSIGAKLWGWISDQWHRLTDTPSTSKWREREKFTAEIQSLIAASGRKPVCLSCGSNDIHPLERLDPVSRSSRYDAGFGFRHPGCQGELREKDSNGTWLAPVIEECLYDLQGQRIPIHPRARELEGPLWEEPERSAPNAAQSMDPQSAYNQFHRIQRHIQANDISTRD